MRILVFAAHPDDAETSVGGSICHHTDAGDIVHVINLTNAGTQRVACAERASRTLGCTCEFLPFHDQGDVPESDGPHRLGLRFDPAHLAVVTDKIREHRPDLVWAHWPVDTHPDHIAAGALALRACDNLRLEGELCPELWFFFPAEGYQALCVHPDRYTDITPYVARKRQAVAEYECVDIWAAYPIHETSDKYHGYQAGCQYAEAFVRCHFRVGEARYRVVGEGLA
jgi:LmbE family N-acetylglucosaminyl deacetylase